MKSFNSIVTSVGDTSSPDYIMTLMLLHLINEKDEVLRTKYGTYGFEFVNELRRKVNAQESSFSKW